MVFPFILMLLAVSLTYCDDTVQRGAQIRLSKKGLQYGASIGIRKLEQELTNKHIPSQGGSSGGITYSATNIHISYLKVGSYDVQPLPGVGLRLSVSGVQISASGRIYVRYKKGWFKVSDTTNVKINGKGVGFSLDIKISANAGKPYLSTTSCSAHISDLGLNFSGGLSWLYNLISSLIENKLEAVLKSVMCKEGQNLVNNEANGFLYDFPVKQNIENWAIIDYSFEKTVMTSSYIDLLLRGEFLDLHNPSHVTPPTFATSSGSSKMAYVWISAYTLNSAGEVFHNAGLLKNVISPKIHADLIPASIKPFLNTMSFIQIIPELYNKYPNQPIGFNLETNKPPTFLISSGGKINVNINVKAVVNVMFSNGTNLPVFYLNIDVSALGFVEIKSTNNQLIVGGHVSDFSFKAAVGGSIIGDIHIPVDNQSVKEMVRGLVIDQANPVLNKGFPIPKIKDLDFVNPAVVIVKDAIRVETDVAFHG